jgi:hypothetical protein
MSAPTETKRRRTGNRPWKGIYGVDRKYTARVDRAKERGQYTPPAKQK